MRRSTRMLTTAVAFAAIAIASRADNAAASLCYACASECDLEVIGACVFQCDGMDWRRCIGDNYEYCAPGEIIVECTDSPN